MTNTGQIYKDSLDEHLQILFRERIQDYLERPDLDPVVLQQLLKSYQKLVDQDLKAKALRLKEKALALKERAMDQKAAEREPEPPIPMHSTEPAPSPAASVGRSAPVLQSTRPPSSPSTRDPLKTPLQRIDTGVRQEEEILAGSSCNGD